MRPGRLQVYTWYEDIVPKLLAAHGLSFRKVPLRTLRPEYTVYGWEVAGLEEFSLQPLKIF